jgi:hypothetical protein
MGRRKGFGVKPPKEKPEYKDAPEVLEMAARLIDDMHGHLAEARIKYMFRTGKWELKGKTIYGRAEKVSAKWKYLTEFDFVITINRDIWFANKPEVRQAILDHELEHCSRGEDDKQGNPKWYIQAHSVEDFVSIIKRHGLWTVGLQNIIKAKEEYEQISMLPETGTEG